MTPANRLKDGLAKLESNGCETQDTVKDAKKAYAKQADRADKHLQEKQERERKKFFGW